MELAADVYDADGEQVLSGAERFGFVFGLGRVFPAIERAIEGRGAGQRCSVRLGVDEAFGARDESQVVRVERDEFPGDVGPGDRFEVEDAAGAVLVLRVIDVDSEEVIVDFNHPLAGQALRYEVRILTVRPASSAELARAEQMLTLPPSVETPLVAPERLLRGASRRYESAPLGRAKNAEPSSVPVIEEKKA